MGAPAVVGNGASKENLNDSSFRWNTHVNHESPDGCALREEVINHDPSRRVWHHLSGLDVGAVEMESEIFHHSDEDACDRVGSHVAGVLEKENRSCAAVEADHIHSLMLESVGAEETESGIF